LSSGNFQASRGIGISFENRPETPLEKQGGHDREWTAMRLIVAGKWPFAHLTNDQGTTA
jgi:hypothetical protein